MSILPLRDAYSLPSPIRIRPLLNAILLGAGQLREALRAPQRSRFPLSFPIRQVNHVCRQRQLRAFHQLHYPGASLSFAIHEQ